MARCQIITHPSVYDMHIRIRGFENELSQFDGELAHGFWFAVFNMADGYRRTKLCNIPPGAN